MDISAILNKNFPETIWTLNGEDYEGLTWLDDSPKPSKKELESLWPNVQFEIEYAIVEKQRQTAYQQEADPIFMQYQRGEATEQEWLDAVQAVKDANPYPVKEEK